MGLVSGEVHLFHRHKYSTLVFYQRINENSIGKKGTLSITLDMLLIPILVKSTISDS